MTISRILWIVPMMSVALAAGSALAIGDGDRSAVRGVIEHQINAFKHDDGAAAYADASPGIKSMIPNQERFLEMVKQSYKPVYRPRSYAFGDSRDTETGFDQSLNLQDEDGVDWVAVYSMEKQPDGAWQIAGCALVKAPGQSV